MTAQTRLTLENIKEGELLANLEYKLSNGERIVMEYQLSKQHPGAPSRTLLQLEHWPDLGSADLPASWLLAIACLHARPWQANALAAHCQIPVSTVETLFAAAAASGLAQTAPIASTAPPPRLSRGDSRFFGWVARRFGLTLFKTAQA